MSLAPAPPPAPAHDSAWRVFLIFLRLGLISFGGPVAHIGYFRTEFVTRRHWLSDAAYAELVALCQFLPGPASSQVGLALGLRRAGYAGALAAWAGFTLPSAAALVALALGLARLNLHHPLAQGTLHGLMLAAVAVVAQALWGMGRTLCPDWPRRALALLTATLALLWPTPAGQVLLMAGAALLGVLFMRPTAAATHPPEAPPARPHLSARAGAAWLLLFLALLLGLPLLTEAARHAHAPALLAAARPALELVDAFYRTGALVFGGGHVVLPLLQAQVVPTGWVSADAFLAGYGAAQAVPGPLFTFAAFLGAARDQAPHGWAGGILGLLAIFAPAFLLLAGALPFWERLRHSPGARAALLAVNAAVVGLLLAAFVNPVLRHGITHPIDALLAALALLALLRWRLPPWAVVAACAAAGALRAV